MAVLSYKFWQERLGGDPHVVGKTLQLDRKNYTIVGVAAPRFSWYNADVYLPLKTDARTRTDFASSISACGRA